MNREFFAIGMMEYGGIGLLIVAGLFIAALDLARAVLLPHANRNHVPQPGSLLRKSLQAKQSQTNQ
jgi:hypothetical protein